MLKNISTHLNKIPKELTHNNTTHVKRLITSDENHPGTIATMNYAWLEPQKQLTLHSHPDGEEFYFFIEGTGEMLIHESWIMVQKGSFLTVPIGKNHSVKNTGNINLCFLTVRTLIR